MSSRLRAADDARAGARRVPIATSLWPETSGATQRQQRAQVGREVDVHVGDHVRVARRPGGAQRAAAALLLEVEERDARQVGGERARAIAGVASVLALLAMTIRQENGSRSESTSCSRRMDPGSAPCSL